MRSTISNHVTMDKLESRAHISQKNKNFKLAPQEFENMLSQMQRGDDSLFEKIYLSQFEDTVKYIMGRFKVNNSQAYDVCMEALLKFRRKLLRGSVNYGNMQFLFNQIASQKFLDSLNKKDTTPLNIEDSNTLTNDHLDALEKAWKRLCKSCSELLENHYYKNKELIVIAENLDKSDVAIRKQKQRCIEKLRVYFLKYYQ